MFFPDRPIRLAHDRYQQFQGGIKRHAFKMRTRIGVDRASGKMLAFSADHVTDGGGMANYSASVASTGAAAALGIYDLPKADITIVALHTRRDGRLDARLRHTPDDDRARSAGR